MPRKKKDEAAENQPQNEVAEEVLSEEITENGFTEPEPLTLPAPEAAPEQPHVSQEGLPENLRAGTYYRFTSSKERVVGKVLSAAGKGKITVEAVTFEHGAEIRSERTLKLKGFEVENIPVEEIHAMNLAAWM